MKIRSHLFLLSLVFLSALSFGQERVADGEYWLERSATSGALEQKKATRWIVYEESPGHFRLESEFEKQPAGIRVVQVEYLTDRFVPTSVGYQLYRKDQPIPAISATCDFANGAIVCTGNSGKDQAPASTPYNVQGAFFPLIEGLSSLDIAWLVAGALNMAHWENGTAQITTLIVSGGSGVMIGDTVNVATLQGTGKPITFIGPDKPIPWSFSSEVEDSLKFVASETMSLEGKDIAVKHYALADPKKPGGIWITEGGVLTKMRLQEDLNLVLKSYRQRKKIIPELPVENASPKEH